MIRLRDDIIFGDPQSRIIGNCFGMECLKRIQEIDQIMAEIKAIKKHVGMTENVKPSPLKMGVSTNISASDGTYSKLPERK